MTIAVFEAEAREAVPFDRLKPAHRVRLFTEGVSAANAAVAADAEIVSVFIYSTLDAAVLGQMKRLKLIATRSTGYDHIDLDYCRAHGIAVCNVPTYGKNTVAEHVFALLLGLSHRLPEAVARARSGQFSPEGLEGFDLAGKTFGVIGTGHIGRHAIRIAKGFAMQVIACEEKPDPALAERLGFRFVPLDELLAESDVISLHVPLTAATQNLLSEAAFARMKSGVVVINTARGGLIDTAALIRALRSGKVAGAGLDVLPEEPLIREEAELVSSAFAGQHDLKSLIANHVLLNMPNVIVTPHSAFYTREAVQRIIETTVGNIEAFLTGAPVNLV
ncbi:MAG: hydroxyacid dehydrogenase [Parvibaculum sp.]|uniref:hydroxyacid dehydrogenase n=1 Tax=Parvibaculum sp. TaxID=2024848 RepID=UPI003C73ADF9